MRERMSNSGEKYLQACNGDFWREVFRAELAYLIQQLQGKRDVLSVGCGPAIIEAGLSEHGFRVVGLDVSWIALDQEADKLRKVTAQAEYLPFPDSSFDAVTYVVSLQFIEDYRKALDSAIKVLKSNGALVVMLLNTESDFFKNKVHDPDSYVSRIRHLNNADIEAAVAERLNVSTEYFLGIKGGKVFESRDATEAALFIVRGVKRLC